MELQNFENNLIKMTKPEVSQLKHQDMLEAAIVKARARSAVSWWWLCIPMYLIAALCMKTFFMPGTTLISNMAELTNKESYSSILLFLFLPIVLMIISAITIRNAYTTSGKAKNVALLQKVWLNVIILIISIIIIIIYSL
ncbi:hypothetical protein JNM05_03240 [bacterium]|nr:hypothetical protein [bacterium]